MPSPTFRACVLRLLAASATAVAATGAIAQPVQWPLATGGNGQFYERVEAPGLTFADARAAAESRIFNGFFGRLLVLETANYAAERDWVFANVYSPGLGTGSQFYWVGATRPNAIGPVADNWTWTDGVSVPTSVSNAWVVDFAEGNVPYGAGFFAANQNTLGDYGRSSTAIVRGYVVEYAVPIPGPASLGVLAAGVMMTRRRRR
ncbi:MAG: hypothetical protein K2Q20_14190 [Phycisphaerales bacterium]|nr:hypothetical protein [Phycisphaerales bacterium]